MLGEKYDPFSRCFRANLFNNQKASTTFFSRCYEHCCVNGTKLYVRVGKNWIPCKPGEDISNIPGFDGQLKCPPIETICAANETSANYHPDIEDPSKNQLDDPW